MEIKSDSFFIWYDGIMTYLNSQFMFIPIFKIKFKIYYYKNQILLSYIFFYSGIIIYLNSLNISIPITR